MKKRFISVKTDKLPSPVKDGQLDIKDRYLKIEVPEELFEYVEGLERKVGELRLMNSLREDEVLDHEKASCDPRVCRARAMKIMQESDAWCLVGRSSSRMQGKTCGMTHEVMVEAAAFIMEKVTGKSLLP